MNTNLEPWINHDLKGQEQAGYAEGELHCKQGWCVDNSNNDSGANTPWMIGYRKGWDAAKLADLYGKEPRKRIRELPTIDPNYKWEF